MADPVDLGGEHSLADVEAAHIRAVLQRLPISQAAKVLGIERSTLLAKRKKWGIEAPLKCRRGRPRFQP